MNRRNRRGPGPIYTFVIIWLLCSFALPMFRLFGIIIALVLAFAGAAAVGKYIERKNADAWAKEDEAKAAAEKAEAERKAKEAPEDRYSAEVNAIINDGRTAISEMKRLQASIDNENIKKKIDELITISDKICRDAIDDPADVAQIRKFLDFYLPTTIKLLNAYDRMDSTGLDGENVNTSKQSIEEMLDTTIAAYKKQLDALFKNQAADIQSDIEVLNGMLAREGLGGKSYLDLNDFLKQYHEQQKGTTTNG